MYLYKPSGGTLHEEGRFVFDGNTAGWRVLPMLDKKDASSPLQCYFPSALIYRTAQDSSISTKPTLPDLQYVSSSHKANRNVTANITKGRGITSSTNAIWGSLYSTTGEPEWSGLNYFIGCNASDGDLLIQRTRQDKQISLTHDTVTGGQITSAGSEFGPPVNLLSCPRHQVLSPPYVNRRKYCYSFAMVIHFSKNMVMSNYTKMQIILPYERGMYLPVTTSTSLREMAGTSGAENSFEFGRFASSGSYDDSDSYMSMHAEAFPYTEISGTDRLFEDYIIRGWIYLTNNNGCRTNGEAAFYLPWIRFRADDLVFLKEQTTGTISINYAECIEGWMDIRS